MGEKPELRYTCTEYREEMRLLGLKRKLEEPGLTAEERKRVVEEISRLEAKMGME